MVRKVLFEEADHWSGELDNRKSATRGARGSELQREQTLVEAPSCKVVRNKKEEPERRRESEASKWPSGLEGAAGAAQGGLFRPRKVWISCHVPWESLGGFHVEGWLI